MPPPGLERFPIRQHPSLSALPRHSVHAAFRCVPVSEWRTETSPLYVPRGRVAQGPGSGRFGYGTSEQAPVDRGVVAGQTTDRSAAQKHGLPVHYAGGVLPTALPTGGRMTATAQPRSGSSLDAVMNRAPISMYFCEL